MMVVAPPSILDGCRLTFVQLPSLLRVRQSSVPRARCSAIEPSPILLKGASIRDDHFRCDDVAENDGRRRCPGELRS